MTTQSTHLADTDRQRATQAAQALADDYKRVADEQRARADGLERRVAMLLAEHGAMIEGQPIMVSLQVALMACERLRSERDQLAADVADLQRAYTLLQQRTGMAMDDSRAQLAAALRAE